MDGIRIAAAFAALALGAGSPQSDRVGAAQPEHKVACKDGTFVDSADDCAQHGGRGQADEKGPARKSQPPNLRAHDTPAHASPYSAFGGQKNAKRPNRKGHKKAEAPPKPLKQGSNGEADQK